MADEHEVERLRHIIRTAGDFRDQIHPDVDWDRVPPWTMDVVRELDRLLAAFDEEDDHRIGLCGEPVGQGRCELPHRHEGPHL